MLRLQIGQWRLVVRKACRLRGSVLSKREAEASGYIFLMSRERDSMFRGNNNDCRIYVGNLPQDCRERDVEDIFYKYGRIGDIRIKRGDAARARQSRRGENLSYAFVQFEDSR